MAKLGNGADFLIPTFENAPWFGYAGLADQMKDAQSAWSKGAGEFAGNNMPKFNGVPGSDPLGQFTGGGFALMKPNVGGGLLGMSAYSGGPNPFMQGFDPYKGRGLNPGGPPPAGPPPTGFPGLPPPAAPGQPADRPSRPGIGQPPTQPPLPPGGGGFFSPRQPGPPTQPQLPPGGGGLLGRPAPGAPPAPPSAGGLLGAPKAAPAPGGLAPTQPGGMPADASDPAALAKFMMTLPPEQQGNFYNAISQYGLTQGKNMGGALHMALKELNPSFSVAPFDNKQGSGFTQNWQQGLPAWLVAALK